MIVKIPDSHNAKKHYQSFLRKKNRKSAKQSEIITYQTKTFKNPNIVNINLVIIEHQKAGCNSSLYSDTKVKLFWTKKMSK